MSSAFFGLDLALRALQAQQGAVDVTNHNVANANTEGFSRQTVEIVTTTPYTLPGLNRHQGAGQIGTGSILKSIERARDLFLDVQYRNELSTQKEAQISLEALEQIEAVFNEPSDVGISNLLTRFFNAWQELAGDPSDSAVRAAMVQEASALANAFNRASDLVTNVQNDLNTQVEMRVDQINSILDQVLALNKQITQVEVSGQVANDFRDRRDLLLDQLSEQLAIRVVENADGSIDVLAGSSGSRVLVDGVSDTDQVWADTSGPAGRYELKFSSDDALVPIHGGELRGLIDARDIKIESYLTELDTIAGDLIDAVNALHTTGFGLDGVAGRPFFAGSDAGTIAVDAAIVGDPDLVGAASVANQAGNNLIALAIAQLRSTMSPSTEGAFGALIARLGVDTQEARGLAENQEILVGLLGRRREAVSGVSLDEETVNLVRFQRAYEAAARLITAHDQMLDKLINETGIVGR